MYLNISYYLIIMSSKEKRTFIYKLKYIWLREIHLEMKLQLILRVMYAFSMGKWTVMQGLLMVMEAVLCNRSHFYIRTIKPVSSITKGMSEPMSYNEVYSLIISFRFNWCLIYNMWIKSMSRQILEIVRGEIFPKINFFAN